MLRSFFGKFVIRVKRYIAGAPPDNIPTLELRAGEDTRNNIIEEVRAERQLNSDVSVWTLDTKDSFFKFLVSIDLAIVGFIVAMSASGHLHALVRSEHLFRLSIQLLVIHFVLCLAIAAIWPRFISAEGTWRYMKYIDLLSRHLQLQNRLQDNRIAGNTYKRAFSDLEAERLRIFGDRPKIYNIVRILSLPWLWALFFTILMAMLLSATKYKIF